MTTSRAEPAAARRDRHDLVVLGAGPAGLAAAVTAATAGARVALIDAGPRPGGQYWRHRPGDDGASHHGWPTFRRLLHGLTAHADRITYLPGHSVWHVERTADEFPGGFRTHAVTTHAVTTHAVTTHTEATHAVATRAVATPPPRGGSERVVDSRTVVVATRAYDRQLPFLGWTLPGVFTAGARRRC
ncbi:FAD-dependent oxidoreductase [Streptomyces sp. NPDC059892]|uniref:FAD-dependent oxidoreductase n=1 Tax=Streptomyces sp. NPDC059892 TaxID=3346989 RepID=UPI003647E149